jgi:hypothetical protein
MMRGIVRHSLCLALTVALVSGSARMGTADSAASHGPEIRLGDVTPTWLRIDPQQPRTIFLGGDTWAERSDDGGSIWHYIADFVPVPVGASPGNTAVADTLTPLVVEPGAMRLYTWGMSSVGHGSAFVLGSHDGGVTWSRLDPGDPERLYMMPSVSPLSAQRLYALEFFENTSLVISSADGGATWREDGDDPGVLQIDLYDHILPLPPIPDPQAVDTVYADGSGSVARSEDAGLTWTAVATPTTTLTKFTVGIDPYRPGRIVARGPGAGPQRWVSADHGRTWSAASCSGVLDGACPAFTVDNVFGAGRSYGFFPDGIHPFTADGPSGPRLDLSTQLPMPITQLLDVRAGTHAGDPV